MRKYKFRGMCLNGNWYYGNLSVLKIDSNGNNSGSYISNKVGMPFAYPVRPDTVGQYIGIKDKNDKEIYEGDIISTEYYTLGSMNNEITEKIIANIYYSDESLGFVTDTDCGRCIDINNSIVIGNIYENSELLNSNENA